LDAEAGAIFPQFRKKKQYTQIAIGKYVILINHLNSTQLFPGHSLY
jgi:hypothetical protein